LKFNLQYLEDKLARVCQACANILLQRKFFTYSKLTKNHCSFCISHFSHVYFYNPGQAALANQPTSISDNDEAGMYLYLNPHDQPEPPGNLCFAKKSF
jgi:hypothetical protein